MNAKYTPRNPPVPSPQTRRPTPPPLQASEPARHLHRQRDYGIGYGNSSGYGSEQHYVDGHVDPIFRCI